MIKKEEKYVLRLRDVRKKDVPVVGGKNASLGEMISQLSSKGVRVPGGFALTVDFYWRFIEENGIQEKLKKIFSDFDGESIAAVQRVGKKARKLFLQAHFSKDLEKEIYDAYKELKQEHKNLAVAVRSSGVAEDAPTDSFAGQFETFLNVKGKKELLKAVKECLTSSFNDRVISYREAKGISHLEFALSIGVQKMVRSDLACSGVMFTLDTETGFRGVVLINSVYGLGEMIVKGMVTPDEFYVFKPTLKQGYDSIIRKDLGSKNRKFIYRKKGGLEEKSVLIKDQQAFTLNNEEILMLARWAVIIEDHYNRPQDIEWAKDGKTGELFVVQSRPETVHAVKENVFYEEYKIKTKELPVIKGIAIGDKIGQGKARIISDVKKISDFQKGEVLVTKMTDPDWVTIFPIASAIVTDEGAKTCFSGDTKVLTNKGFMTFKELYFEFKGNGETKLQVSSFETEKNKMVWRPITEVFKRKAATSKILVSSFSDSGQGQLEVTGNHQFLTLKNRKVIKKEISSIISSREGVLVPQVISRFSSRDFLSKESYFLGGILSDGSFCKNKQGGYVVSFFQKYISEKLDFIRKMKLSLGSVYDKKLKLSFDSRKGREKDACFRCYSKDVYSRIKCLKENLVPNILSMDKENLLMFLAGILDGDGNVSDHQVQITVGEKKEDILQAIITASLRLGFAPSVCKRKGKRGEWVVSFDKKFSSELLRFSQRLSESKFSPSSTPHVKKFVSRQVIKDIIDKIDQRGRMKHDYLVRNNMITDYKIKNFVFPRVEENLKREFEKLLEAPFTMHRTKFLSEKNDTKTDVFNLSVNAPIELNHNYVVLTQNYTPVIVGNCHAAIVAREFGVPCIVGTGNASKLLKNREEVTVDCTQGLEGRVFKGKVDFSVKKYDLKEVPELGVKIMVNIGAPEIAFKSSFLPVSGVGLARQEFIIAEKIRVHPLALYHYNEIKDARIKRKIDELTIEHKDKKEHFIKELAEGVAQITAAFYPKEVILRLSDFKTSEYGNLVGGKLFEEQEGNPMLGFRGAARYLDKKFQPAFKMECEAIKRVRDVFGLKNISLMVPFCRTVEEGKKVLKLMEKFGLKRGKGLKVYVMCEIPSNIVLADEFLEIFDGMSIGTNDLTQLVLGLDRDNARIAPLFDERDPAVKKMVSEVIHACNAKNKYSGICGDAPSTFLDFAQFLIDSGIESISLSPDAVMKTILALGEKNSETMSAGHKGVRGQEIKRCK